MSHYIPKKIKVGFQTNRKDTLDGKLAYVIYYDDKGKLRKETSWNGWRNEKEPVLDLDNEPISGICLSKGHTRYYYSSYSRGGKSVVIRVYDPRGFEFEISPSNLVDILAHTDCIKQDLQSKMVYAWDGTELVLLSVNSEEYKESKKHTDLQGLKVSAKELVAGRTYMDKHQRELVYLGYHKYYEWDWNHGNYPRTRKWKKKHVFHDGSDKNGLVNMSAIPTNICKCISEECSEMYSDYMDGLAKNINYNDIESIVAKKIEPKHSFQVNSQDSDGLTQWQRDSRVSYRHTLPTIKRKLKSDAKKQYGYIKEGELYRKVLVFKEGCFRLTRLINKDSIEGDSYYRDDYLDNHDRQSYYFQPDESMLVKDETVYSLKYKFENGETTDV